MFSEIAGRPIQWLIHPDPTGAHKHLAWTQKDERPAYVFVANTDTDDSICNFNIPRSASLDERSQLVCEFSTSGRVPDVDKTLTWRDRGYKVAQLAAGEGRVYSVVAMRPQERHNPVSAHE
jgi:hypothetical protein